jgi:hypothetical protein
LSHALERIRQVAKTRKKERFTTLFHHISVDLLREAFHELRADAAPGVDRLTWTDYEADLGRRLEDLHDRVHRGAYRALPNRRVYTVGEPPEQLGPVEGVAAADRFLTGTGARIEAGGERAYYRPSTDTIHMPLGGAW